jgi:hypothetical protein
MERRGVKWSSASEEEGTEGAALWCAVEGLTPMLMRRPFPGLSRSPDYVKLRMRSGGDWGSLVCVGERERGGVCLDVGLLSCLRGYLILRN